MEVRIVDSPLAVFPIGDFCLLFSEFEEKRLKMADVNHEDGEFAHTPSKGAIFKFERKLHSAWGCLFIIFGVP